MDFYVVHFGTHALCSNLFKGGTCVVYHRNLEAFKKDFHVDRYRGWRGIWTEKKDFLKKYKSGDL